MGLEQFIGNPDGVELEPFNGEYEKGTLYTEDVLVKFGEYEYIVEFDDRVSWEDATEQAIAELAQEWLESKRQEEILVPKEGGKEMTVGEDTKLFDTLLVIAYLEPVPTHIVGDVLQYDKPGNPISSGKGRGFVQAVAENGKSHYYTLTSEGWKQIVGVHGVEGWRRAAEELISQYVPEDIDDSKVQAGLERFGYDGGVGSS